MHQPWLTFAVASTCSLDGHEQLKMNEMMVTVMLIDGGKLRLYSSPGQIFSEHHTKFGPHPMFLGS